MVLKTGPHCYDKERYPEGPGSGREGDVRTAVRQFLQKNLKQVD